MIWNNVTTALLAGAFSGIITAYIAHRKERNPLPWFFVGFIFGLIGLLFFFFLPRAKKKETPITLQKIGPQPYLFGPADKFWYFLDKDHAQVGPMSYSALSDHWKKGSIHPTTFVWHEELTDWKPLQELIRI